MSKKTGRPVSIHRYPGIIGKIPTSTFKKLIKSDTIWFEMQAWHQHTSYFLQHPGAFLQADNGGVQSCLHRVESAHTDAITVLEPYAENCVATASNDGTVRIWNPTLDKCLQPKVCENASALVNLFFLKTGSMISATESGTLTLWANPASQLPRAEADVNDKIPWRKKYPSYRASIRSSSIHHHGSNDALLVGTSCYLQTYRSQNLYYLGYTKVSEYEPIEFIQELDHKRIALGIDGMVSIWEKPNRHTQVQAYKRVVNLYEVGESKQSYLCNYLTASALLNTQHMAVALSSGKIKVLDLQKSYEARDLVGHCKKTTSMCALSPAELASGSEDTNVKLWDLRANSGCVKTLSQYPAKITRLLYNTTHALVVASFTDSSISGQKANLALWDLRK